MSNTIQFPTAPRNETLAELISKVLNHPDTPASLYNAMVDELADLENQSVLTSPEKTTSAGHINLVLSAHQR